MNILIINQPVNNRGDESAHKALMRRLNAEFPQATIWVQFVNVAENSIRQMQISNAQNIYLNCKKKKGLYLLVKLALRFHCVLLLSFFHPTILCVKRTMKKADFVICAPGGSCLGHFKDWFHLYWMFLAKSLKKKVVYFGRSFGPFSVENKWDKIFKERSIHFLQNVDFLSIRDAETCKIAEEFGIKYVETLDSAFLDQPKATFSSEWMQGDHINQEYVVFVPNSLVWHRIFRNADQNAIKSFYQKIMKFFIDRHKPIVLLPQLFNSPINDYMFFKSLTKNFESENIFVLNDTISSDEQQRIISKASFVIGARYHSIVFAINNERKFLSLTYEHKMEGLLTFMELQDFQIDIRRISEENVALLFDEFKERLARMEAKEVSFSLAKKKAEIGFGLFIEWIHRNR